MTTSYRADGRLVLAMTDGTERQHATAFTETDAAHIAHALNTVRATSTADHRAKRARHGRTVTQVATATGGGHVVQSAGDAGGVWD